MPADRIDDGHMDEIWPDAPAVDHASLSIFSDKFTT